jgi:hypothetical protein
MRHAHAQVFQTIRGCDRFFHLRPIPRFFGILAERENGWLGRESNLDMAISKADALACPKGFTEPRSSEFISRPKHSNFENRTESAESRDRERIEPFGEEWAGYAV